MNRQFEIPNTNDTKYWIASEILVPLGLTHTAMLHQRDIVRGLASSYFFRDDLKTLVNDLPVYQENWYASGGMYSTARPAFFDGVVREQAPEEGDIREDAQPWSRQLRLRRVDLRHHRHHPQQHSDLDAFVPEIGKQVVGRSQ